MSTPCVPSGRASRPRNDKTLIEAHAKRQLFAQPGSRGGNPRGSLTVVEFFDYNCSYCKRAHPLIQQLLSEDKGSATSTSSSPILGETSYYAARAASGE